MTTIYWWIIDDEESEFCGEQFFTEIEGGRKEHNDYVRDLFPNENLRCLGRVTEEEAEVTGLDTY